MQATKIFVNGVWVGVHRDPAMLVRTLRQMRRQVRSARLSWSRLGCVGPCLDVSGALVAEPVEQACDAHVALHARPLCCALYFMSFPCSRIKARMLCQCLSSVWYVACASQGVGCACLLWPQPEVCKPGGMQYGGGLSHNS